VIALVGAESTGKTTLAAALAGRIAQDTGLSCTSVAEVLREWCDREGRTPRADEQQGIAQAQQARIAQAASAHDVVVADTTALMIAVYSRLVFGDRSLDDWAAQQHRQSVHLTLLTALDLPWVADGLQRDGPHVRGPVDAALREPADRAHALPWSLVAGHAGEPRPPRRSGTAAPQNSQPTSTSPRSAMMESPRRGPGRAACAPTRSREQRQAKRGPPAGLEAAQRLFPEQAVQHLSMSSVSSSARVSVAASIAMRLKASLRPIWSSLLPARGQVALALDRQALDQQAGGDLVVGGQHQPVSSCSDCSM
jgi:nicotinamide riboside kinase